MITITATNDPFSGYFMQRSLIVSTDANAHLINPGHA